MLHRYGYSVGQSPLFKADPKPARVRGTLAENHSGYQWSYVQQAIKLLNKPSFHPTVTLDLGAAFMVRMLACALINMKKDYPRNWAAYHLRLRARDLIHIASNQSSDTPDTLSLPGHNKCEMS